MTQGNEKKFWWKVAMHLDEAQLALANAMAINTDDPSWIFALQSRLSEAQALLLGIFQSKGLAPGGYEAPQAPMEMPPPAPPFWAEPAASPEDAAAAAPTTEQPAEEAAVETAVIEASSPVLVPDIASGASMPGPTTILHEPSNGVVPAALVQEVDQDADVPRSRH